jgi:RNA polymerase sigma-70 factor, ECF subfamily
VPRVFEAWNKFHLSNVYRCEHFVVQDVRERLKGQLRGLFGFAMALVRDEDRARDLVQDTAVKAIAARDVPTDGTAFRVWLFRILRNTFVDQTRRDRMTYVDPVDLETDAGDDGWKEERQITVIAVRSAFAELSEPHRNVLALVDVAGMSYAEAADILDVPTGTIMSRVARARTSLLGEIEKGNVTPFSMRKKRARK